MRCERLQAGNSHRSPVVTAAGLFLDSRELAPGSKGVSTVPRILVLVLLVSLALIAAACGGAPKTPGVAALGSTTTTSSQSDGSPTTGTSKAAALASYSACMRSHGVPKFPDPKASS